MTPPAGTQQVFIGCGRDVDTTIQIGAAMPPDQLFNLKYYPSSKVSLAAPVKSFYAYYSTSGQTPLGFTASRHIYLGYWDQYDCEIDEKCDVENADHHRLSVLTGMCIINIL